MRIQPNNSEIRAELDSVNLARIEAKSKSKAAPLDTGQTCEASGSSPSCVRLKKAPPPDSSFLSPFECTERDKRRLKLILRPLTVDSEPEKENFAYPSWDRYDVKVL